MKKAVIILPTYNEKENLITLIPAIFGVAKKISHWKIYLLIVDDSSPDHTDQLVKKMQDVYPHLYLIQGEKKGLGNAYFRGFKYVISHFDSHVLFEMDADWSHDPKYIPLFLKKIDEGDDFVVGARYIKGGSIPSDWGFHRKLFSILGNLIIKYGFMNRTINDWTTGYRAIKTSYIKEAVNSMEMFNGYVFQVAFLDKAYKQGLAISEIPIHFKDRTKGTSKIHSIEYIVNTLWYVCTHSSFIRFVIVGSTSFFVDFTIAFLLINQFKLPILIGSSIISPLIALVYNFIFNNFWSFSHKKVSHSLFSYIKHFALFIAVSFGSVFIQYYALKFALRLLPHNRWYIYKALIIILLNVPYSYFMYNYVIWKKKTAL
ncbi:MAG TPA: glycosyltransferase [Patescibacteria group bacterium]|nr:glycosyltransferase [Patescibacteria group bacterium]